MGETMQEEAVCNLLREARDLFFCGDQAGYDARLAQTRQMIGQTAEERWLLGEWTLLTSLSQMRDPAALLRIYKEALRFMDGRRSVIMTADSPMDFAPDSVLWVMHQEPGTADIRGRVFAEALTHYRTLTGRGQGYAEFYQAELAYHRGDLAQARVLAYQAVYIAQNTRQRRLAVSAAKLIGYIVINTNSADIRDWTFAVRTVAEVAMGDGNVYDLADPIVCTANVVRCEMLLQLHDFESLPEWMKEGRFDVYEADGIFGMRYRSIAPNTFALDYPQSLWLHALYLLYTGQYVRALAVDTVQRMFGIEDSILCYRIYFGLLRGTCHLLLGERERAREEFFLAAQLAVPDGLWLTLGMFAPASDGLVQETVEACGGDAAAVKRIGYGFQDSSRRLRDSVLKADIDKLLTPREREISRLVSTGMRNREIAEALNVTEQTIKFHISNIYAKLEIDNRTKLVALMKSYTENYTKV